MYLNWSDRHALLYPRGAQILVAFAGGGITLGSATLPVRCTAVPFIFDVCFPTVSIPVTGDLIVPLPEVLLSCEPTLSVPVCEPAVEEGRLRANPTRSIPRSTEAMVGVLCEPTRSVFHVSSPFAITVPGILVLCVASRSIPAAGSALVQLGGIDPGCMGGSASELESGGSIVRNVVH